MFLLSSSLLGLINKLSLISNITLLVPWAKMMKSSKENDHKKSSGHLWNSS